VRWIPVRTAAIAGDAHGLGWVLGAVRGGNRRGALGDRHRVPVAVGLRGHERCDRLRRRRHRCESSRYAPLSEDAPVMSVGAPGRRRDRRRGVPSGALELTLDRDRGRRQAHKLGRASQAWATGRYHRARRSLTPRAAAVGPAAASIPYGFP
jgi:hypothetical protein